MTLYDQLLVALLPPLGRSAVRLLGHTLKVRELGLEHVEPFWKEKSPLIYTVWHGRMLLIPYLYGAVHGVHVMASRHRDGELVSRFVQGFGFRPVRGSTTRGGAAALRALARRLQAGEEVAVIPDGPLGPRYVVQPGVVTLGKISGAPIVPMSVGAGRGWTLRSWDEFLIPGPFSKLIVIFGEPIRVPPHADRTVQEERRKCLEESLRDLTWEADKLSSFDRTQAGGQGVGGEKAEPRHSGQA